MDSSTLEIVIRLNLWTPKDEIYTGRSPEVRDLARLMVQLALVILWLSEVEILICVLLQTRVDKVYVMIEVVWQIDHHRSGI